MGQKLMLRSHLDSVRSVLCDEASGVLLSTGEDALIKCWDLNVMWSGGINAEEPEPAVTLRRHTAPVMAMALRQQDRVIFSAGMDKTILAWHTPPDREGYSSGTRQWPRLVDSMKGHEDTVWGLEHHAHLPYLLSASADGNIGLWSTENGGQMAAAFTRPALEDTDLDAPVCALGLQLISLSSSVATSPRRSRSSTCSADGRFGS